MTWAKAIEGLQRLIIDGNYVELGLCGPHLNFGRKRAERYYARMAKIGGDSTVRYGSTPLRAVRKLIEGDASDV